MIARGVLPAIAGQLADEPFQFNVQEDRSSKFASVS